MLLLAKRQRVFVARLERKHAVNAVARVADGTLLDGGGSFLFQLVSHNGLVGTRKVAHMDHALAAGGGIQHNQVAVAVLDVDVTLGSKCDVTADYPHLAASFQHSMVHGTGLGVRLLIHSRVTLGNGGVNIILNVLQHTVIGGHGVAVLLDCGALLIIERVKPSLGYFLTVKARNIAVVKAQVIQPGTRHINTLLHTCLLLVRSIVTLLIGKVNGFAFFLVLFGIQVFSVVKHADIIAALLDKVADVVHGQRLDVWCKLIIGKDTCHK